jgi:[protein-PII] uridylyltransferase
VATFGERAVDVFYVTDLMGAKIASPTRTAAIKRALIGLFASASDGERMVAGV